MPDNHWMSVIGPNLIVASTAERDAPDYDISDAQALASFLTSQLHHFWFTARLRVITGILNRSGLRPPATIMEVGCGTGTVLKHLRAGGYEVDGMDMHLALCRQAAANCPEATIYCHDLLHGEINPVSCRYQAVGLFDVLEHITETTTFLEACMSLVTDGGLIVGTVPALMSLWSTYDLACGHKRRYSARTLREALQAAGLQVVDLGYFFQVLLPAMWLQRHRKLKSHHGPLHPANQRPAEGLHRAAASEPAGRERNCDSAATLIEILAVPPWPINAAFTALCAVERGLGRILPLRRLPGPSLFFAARR